MTATGSRPSLSGHSAHRGRPARSRLQTRRGRPHAAHGSRTSPHTPQYQSSPRRCRVRSALPHSAHAGGEITVAPALTSAISRSPTARGAGDRLSDKTPGRPARAWASRRCLARPPATAVTAARIASRSRPGSALAISVTMTPTGGVTASPAGSVTGPGDPGASRPQAADAGLAAGGPGLLLVLPAGRNRLDPVRHAAFPGVQHPPRALHAQPFGPFGPQPGDPARRQPELPVGPPPDQG